jgi:lysozyme
MLSDKGAEALMRFEGCRTAAYQDVGGAWTIGYGHTGPEVVKGLVWTQADCQKHFRADVARFESGVAKATTPIISQQQFDALVSLAFNIGLGAYRESTLLKKLNAGDHVGAACQFVRWNKVGGQYNEGLALRRAAEMYMFARGCPE